MRLLVTGGSGFIGTNLVDYFLKKGCTILNLDIREPLNQAQRRLWVEGDILDEAKLIEKFKHFKPTSVIHLAAKTDSSRQSIAEFSANTAGTGHVLEAIRACPSVDRVVVTSSQFVHSPGSMPAGDADFKPHTAYGESKAVAERLTRAANLICPWTIVRPTNIWGPWHLRYAREFWHVLERGWYLHPATSKPVVRSYGFVGNVVWQIGRILEAPENQINGRVYYLGDEPIALIGWVNAFSYAISGRKARVVPATIVWCLAAIGSLLSKLGLVSPITLTRYKSMTQDYVVPMQPTFEAFGMPPYSLQEGVAETVRWLKRDFSTFDKQR